LDYYTAQCLVVETNSHTEELGDTWRLKGTAFNSTDGGGSGHGSIRWDQFYSNLSGPDPDGFITRLVDDCEFYIANKSLLKWYYSPETNSWKSNHTRPSSVNQFRILVTLPESQLVRGCINPMSVPATFNKPTFMKGTYYTTEYVFMPGLFEHYLVPWHVLIEGKTEESSKNKWELMDEFTLEHFSARSNTYFSYPRKVKYLRITVQDWYGNSLMEDMRGDYIYGSDNYYSSTTTPGRHYNEYSALMPRAYDIVRYGSGANIGEFLDDTINETYATIRVDWQKWKARTIQSLWKGIYIPPFLFFGDNGEP
jgi:hypothetical protein